MQKLQFPAHSWLIHANCSLFYQFWVYILWNSDLKWNVSVQIARDINLFWIYCSPVWWGTCSEWRDFDPWGSKFFHWTTAWKILSRNVSSCFNGPYRLNLQPFGGEVCSRPVYLCVSVYVYVSGCGRGRRRWVARRRNGSHRIHF